MQDYTNFIEYTDGFTMVKEWLRSVDITKHFSKRVRLLNNANIFRAELRAITLHAMSFIRRSKETNLIIFFQILCRV